MDKSIGLKLLGHIVALVLIFSVTSTLFPHSGYTSLHFHQQSTTALQHWFLLLFPFVLPVLLH